MNNRCITKLPFPFQYRKTHPCQTRRKESAPFFVKYIWGSSRNFYPGRKNLICWNGDGFLIRAFICDRKFSGREAFFHREATPSVMEGKPREQALKKYLNSEKCLFPPLGILCFIRKRGSFHSQMDALRSSEVFLKSFSFKLGT